MSADTVDVEAIRDLHTPPVFDVDDRESYCICGHPYPCDAARLLDALASSEAALREAEAALHDLDADLVLGATARARARLARWRKGWHARITAERGRQMP